ncbi:hypothetical protein J6590_038190 [Homalodisca vitripennis]|nr:hypothetical protein J6590_038190 [Homalodisca vitripennis]
MVPRRSHVCCFQVTLNCHLVNVNRGINPKLDEKKTRSARQRKFKDCRGLGLSQGSATLTKEFSLTVMDKFKEYFSEMLNTFKGGMVEMTASINFFSDKVDMANNLIGEPRGELSVLKNRNELLRGNVKPSPRKKTHGVCSTVCELQGRVRALEQNRLPVTPQEDIMSIDKDVGAAIGVHVTVAHRVPPSFRKERTPSLVVQFYAKTLKDI